MRRTSPPSGTAWIMSSTSLAPPLPTICAASAEICGSFGLAVIAACSLVLSS
jgi:hypothetical protein